MTTHLATRQGILCYTPAKRPTLTGVLSDVSCYRCEYHLRVTTHEESEAACDRARFAKAAAAAESLGASRLWELVAADAGTPTDEMVRNILAAILTGLAESNAMDAAA